MGFTDQRHAMVNMTLGNITLKTGKWDSLMTKTSLTRGGRTLQLSEGLFLRLLVRVLDEVLEHLLAVLIIPG